MFNELPSNFDFPAMEKETLQFWEDHRVYDQSLEARKGGKPFVFFEGPPTANGLPHPGHCLTRAMKDLFPRYKTMTGHYCLRKGGWDTHGLPVEVEVCKELGIHSKEDIEAYGVEPFNRKCLESVFRYTKEWETLTRRLGFWVNLEEAYVTYHKSYIESVWWSLKRLFDAGMLYQGHKIVWWWAQGGTALSSGEVGQGYREVDDPSVFVRFPIVMDGRAKSLFSPGPQDQGDSKINASFLVWTTTPWTLSSNTFAAVHNDFDYAIVHDEETGERLIFAAALVEQIAKKAKKKSWKIEKTVKGADLVGLSYKPPFDYYRKRPARDLVPHAEPGIPLGDFRAPLNSDAAMPYVLWRVLHADFVTLDSGTGLVHEAPAFGEVDYDLLQQERKRFKNPDSVPLLCAVAPNGKFTDDAPPYKGRWVKECDKDIVRELKEKKAYSATVDIPVLLHQEQYRHDYPFCWRADQDPLIQYPRKSWFIRTTQFKDDMLANNEHINWLPDHIKSGRFGKFLETNVDWSLSRERYWGTPLPIWVCESCGQMEAVDSYDALVAKPGVAGLEVWENAKKNEPSLSDHLKVHKPYIDAITYACHKCDTHAASPIQSRDRKEAVGARTEGSPERASERPPLPHGRGSVMRRVPEVIDCWYDSGAMPFAQWGFPHANKEMFATQFPADFISEALDQTRGWFYSLTAISVMLFGKNGVARKEYEDARKQGEHGPLARANRRGVATAPISLDLSTRRRILPHWEMGGSTYFITFRLNEGQLSESERDTVMSACRHWDGTRIELHAAVVMPDHVHLLFTPKEKAPSEWWSLADLMHSIKGFTAQEINKSRSSSGPVWQQEYYDRIIRSESDFEEKFNYIVTNPARRELPEVYRWLWTQSHGPEAHAPRAHQQSLEYPHPFHNCIVLGLLMGEDGLKMSKSKKNYKEPTYIFDKEGSDAMRWLFFSGQTPWTSIRFQEAAIAEGQREFIIRLYNCYSFFVIYANIDKWTPSRSDSEQSRARQEAVSAPNEGRSELGKNAANANPLDRWIRSELASTCLRVYDTMEAYDNYSAARALIAFVDALSNWYVRRSRDRFWKTEMDADKRAAYETLHHCLVTTTKLIAPFTPFIAESMYQNLVRSHDKSAPESVHLCDYPVTADTRAAEEAQVDAKLNEEIEMVRQLVSCGRAARSASKLRVRQPLGAIELFHRNAEVVKRYDDIIRDELNVKHIEHVTNAQIDKYVNYQVKPNFQIIGPKHGPLAPKIKGLLAKHPNPDEIVRQMEAQGTYHMNVDGQDVELTPDELMIELHAREGYAAERVPGCGILVLDTHITPELLNEGYARDLVNQIQQVRKNLNLRYEQRIHLAITGDADVTRVVNAHAKYIASETLADSILNQPIAGVEAISADLDGHLASVHVKAI